MSNHSLRIGLTSLIFVSSMFAQNAPQSEVFTPHSANKDQQTSIKITYQLREIGKTDLLPEELTKQNLEKMLAPAINFQGKVTYNAKSGGTFYENENSKYTPAIKDTVIFFHDINDSGDILVSIDRGAINSLDWMIWYDFNSKNHDKQSFDFGEIDPSGVHFQKLNRNRSSAGFLGQRGRLDDPKIQKNPIIWDSLDGLKKIGAQYSFRGIVRDLNNTDGVVGIQELDMHQRPFFWHPEYGLKEMNDYYKVIKPKGWTAFDNLVLTNDDIIYGTYWFIHFGDSDSERQSRPHFAFRWNPINHELSLIDLKGMLISDVNSSHTLVGKLDGQASVRFQNRNPELLKNLLSTQNHDSWELLEATSINDRGVITGYGKRNGEMTIFIAEPIANGASTLKEIGT